MARMVIMANGRHALGAVVSDATPLYRGQFTLVENATDKVLSRGINRGSRATFVRQPHTDAMQRVDAASFATLPVWLVQRVEANRENGDYRDDMTQEAITRLYSRHGAFNVAYWLEYAWCDVDNEYLRGITRDVFRIVAETARDYARYQRPNGLTHVFTGTGQVHEIAAMQTSIDALLGTVAEPVDEGDTGANSRAERMAWEIRRVLSPKQLEAVMLKAKGQPLTSTQRVQLKLARDKLAKLQVLPPKPATVKRESKPRDKYVSTLAPWSTRFAAAVSNARLAPSALRIQAASKSSGVVNAARTRIDNEALSEMPRALVYTPQGYPVQGWFISTNHYYLRIILASLFYCIEAWSFGIDST